MVITTLIAGQAPPGADSIGDDQPNRGGESPAAVELASMEAPERQPPEERSPGLASLIEASSRRRLAQWLFAYGFFAWVTVQVAEVLGDIFDWPGSLLRALVWTLGFGFLATAVVAWFHGERGPQRVRPIEVVLLVAIGVSAAGFLGVQESGWSRQHRSAETAGTGASSNRSSRRITASRGHDAEPAWSPDGRSLVFVSERDGHANLWIKSLDGGVRQLTSHAAEDAQPDWSPDGRHILFASSRDRGPRLDRSAFLGYSLGGGIWRVPAFGGEAVRVVDDGYNPAWSPDGATIAFDAHHEGARRIWLAGADGDARQVLSSDDSRQTAHTRPAWSPDGRWLVFERQSGSHLGVIELWLTSRDGTVQVPLLVGPSRHFDATWADASRIVFASDRSGSINLWQITIDPDDGRALGDPTPLTVGAGEDVGPALSRDGRLGYVSLRRWTNIWRVAIDPATWTVPSRPEPVFETDWNNGSPALSPDGGTLAFDSDREGVVDVWTLPSGTDTPTRLTRGPGRKLQPAWSPDGRHLAYFSDQAGSNDIWIVASEGGEPVRITDSPADDINPFWSVDGDRLAFVSDRSGQAEIWVMRADGSQARQVTEIGVTGHTARFSPDGRWILFTAMADGDRDVWMVNVADGALRRVTDSPAQEAHGLWSPDGRQVLYLSDHRTLWAVSVDGGAPTRVFQPGDRIDHVQLAPAGDALLFTRERLNGDLWVME